MALGQRELGIPAAGVNSVGASTRHGYLEMFNLFRCVACLAVLGQHSFIWTGMSNNFVGTGFITMLHLSRTSFFFLSALVVTYAQLDHPRRTGDFWKRRYWELVVPYLAWTAIYLGYTLATVSVSWDQAEVFLRHNLLLGFSQMYFIVVLFQFYLVCPFLLRWLRSTRHHWRILFASLSFAALVGCLLHYPHWFGVLSSENQRINGIFPWGRDFLVYQEFFVVGMLVALHFDEVLRFVSRNYRRIMTGTVVVGLLVIGWYAVSVWTGTSIGTASDIYAPEAVLWCLSAIAGIFALSWCWQRSRFWQNHSARGVAYLAGLTGGVFFAHTLFINLIRSILQGTGLVGHMPWEGEVLILFVGTVMMTGTFVAIVQHTPLRWVLGGPIRSEQRRSYELQERSRDAQDDGAAPLALACARG